ncbi:hypothetical protein ACH47Z_46250 [Streptomyces sp. NPDC020192]|uniref:hypothetical protein n=1 Tax=Streptomyces sp. NPDC020192 TaxID=3365066 RepID=UPI0037A3B23A
MPSADVAEGRDAEVHGGVAAGLFGIQLGELVLGSCKADFKSFQLAKPALAFGLDDAGEEVVADLDQAAALVGLGTQYRAADTGVFVDARGAERASADADGEVAALKVAEEGIPLLRGGGAVLLTGAQGAAAGDERAMGLDGLGRVDR